MLWSVHSTLQSRARHNFSKQKECPGESKSETKPPGQLPRSSGIVPPPDRPGKVAGRDPLGGTAKVQCKSSAGGDDGEDQQHYNDDKCWDQAASSDFAPLAGGAAVISSHRVLPWFCLLMTREDVAVTLRERDHESWRPLPLVLHITHHKRAVEVD